MSSGLRNSLAILRQRPGVTTVAVLTLALGIEANTAVFGVIDATILRPLPYAESENLVVPLMSVRDSSLSSLLTEVSPTDPITYMGVTGLFLAVTLLATIGPAWRAARVAPLEALRHE